MKDRILDLANFIFHEANNLTKHQVTEFYKLAHADGQRAMREKAAKECRDEGLYCTEDSIRLLEIE